MARLRRLFVALVALSSAVPLIWSTPARADDLPTQADYEEGHASSLPFEVSVPVELPVGGSVTPQSTILCNILLSTNSSYNKPSFSLINREHGDATITSDCDSTLITLLSASAKVADFGVGVLASTHQTFNQNNGSGFGPVYAPVDQDISLYTFPTDYHGPGSFIKWDYHGHAVSNTGRQPTSASRRPRRTPSASRVPSSRADRAPVPLGRAGRAGARPQ